MKALPSLRRSACRSAAFACIAAVAIATTASATGPSISVSVFPEKITNEGQDASFTLTLSSPSSRKIAMHFAMTGSAGAGNDFVLVGNFNFGRVVIPTGQSSATVILHSLNGGPGPVNSIVTFNILGGDHYRIGHPSNATLRIQNLP